MSTVFTWDKEEIEQLLAVCGTDGIFPYIEKYLPKGSKVLESGCGLGRYIRYLHDRGWDVTGLEINEDAVKVVKKYWPDLKIKVGDSASSPFKASSFDGIISLGVIEHWPEGPTAPLADIYRTLKPGGVALITTPCINTVRKIKYLTWAKERGDRAAWKSWRETGHPKPNRFNKDYLYFTHPAFGEFFEYRFTKKQFLSIIEEAGFEVVEHRPSAVIDGLYHELNPGKKLAQFEKWQFQVSPIGKAINATLSIFPFFHPHMQIIVARKPLKKSRAKKLTR